MWVFSAPTPPNPFYRSHSILDPHVSSLSASESVAVNSCVVAVVYTLLRIAFITGAGVNDKSVYSSFVGGSVSTSSSSGNGYQVSTTQLSVNGRCTSTLNIVGHGIRKLIDFPCNSVPYPIINVDQILVVGGEYYTETPGVLTHVVGDVCHVEYFQDQTGRPASHVATITTEDCHKVKQRIVVLREYYERWAEYYKKKQQESQQHLQAIQSNIFSALGGLFSGLPFGK